MVKQELVGKLIELLLVDLPKYRDEAQAIIVSGSDDDKRQLLRALMNVRPPMPLSEEYLALERELLTAERIERGEVSLADLTPVSEEGNIYLWQGDITRLKVDAIVNAANSKLLGCFIPNHRCIDNAIHSAAGLELRAACDKLMRQDGRDEPTGSAKITAGYNLPAHFVIHTVGPIVGGALTEEHRRLLASCYSSSLKLAASHGLTSIAFCCISTGEFRFPPDKAARIAVVEVKKYLVADNKMQVVFNVFKDIDRDIYKKLLA